MPTLAPLRLHAPSRPDAVVVDLPVVLAPMAGVTNAAYRQLCREQGAGLYVCEMITSRGKVVLPHGWYDDTSGCELDLAEAELDVSGG